VSRRGRRAALIRLPTHTHTLIALRSSFDTVWFKRSTSIRADWKIGLDTLCVCVTARAGEQAGVIFTLTGTELEKEDGQMRCGD